MSQLSRFSGVGGNNGAAGQKSYTEARDNRDQQKADGGASGTRRRLRGVCEALGGKRLLDGDESVQLRPYFIDQVLSRSPLK